MIEMTTATPHTTTQSVVVPLANKCLHACTYTVIGGGNDDDACTVYVIRRVCVCVCRGIRDDIEQEDDHESYFKAVANTIIVGDDAEDEWDYDDEGNPIPPERSKVSRLHPSASPTHHLPLTPCPIYCTYR